MKRAVGMLGALAMAAGCASSTTERLRLPPLQTVTHVELSRYLGTWYEIASFPQRFQRGCTATTATYALRADGDIDVLNRCRKGSTDDYSYAVVGHPGRDYLWILARNPTMAEATYQSIVTRLQAQGYETSRLVRTPQVAAPPAASAARAPEGS